MRSSHCTGWLRMAAAWPPGPRWPGIILLLCLASGLAPTRVFAAEMRVTHDPAPQLETCIAVDHNRPLSVVAAFRDLGVVSPTSTYGGLGVAYSNDGGDTFTHLGGIGGGIPLLPGFDESGGDPGVGFDTEHRVFYTFLGMSAGTSFSTRSNGLFCATSTAGGAAWNAAVPVATNSYNGVDEVPFEDKPLIAVDDWAASPFRDNAYVSWVRDYPAAVPHPSGTGTGGGDIMFARSVDHGQSWTVVGSITTPALEPLNTGTNSFGTRVSLPEPEVAPNGDVFVLYWVRGRLNCSRSTDGGLSFASPTYPFGPVLTTTVSIPSPLPNEVFRVNSCPNIETDPTRPGSVYVVAGDDDDTPNSSDAANVFFARSVDGGATWEPRVKLNDDGIVAHQFHPWMAVDNFGEIAVIWYDTRNDPLNHQLDVYGTLSLDGGVTWQPNVRITSASFEPNTPWPFAPQGPGWMGEYIGVAAADAFHLVWADTRTESGSELEIYYARLIGPAALDVPRRPEGRKVIGRVVPNPMRRDGSLQFSLPQSGAVRATVFDIRGRIVRRLMDERFAGAGSYQLPIVRRPTHDEALPPGVYIFMLQTDVGSDVGRFVVLR